MEKISITDNTEMIEVIFIQDDDNTILCKQANDRKQTSTTKQELIEDDIVILSASEELYLMKSIQREAWKIGRSARTYLSILTDGIGNCFQTDHLHRDDYLVQY